MHCTLLLLTGCLSLTLLSSRCTETLLARRAHTSLTASHVSAGTLICCPTHGILQCHGGLQKKLTYRIFKNELKLKLNVHIHSVALKKDNHQKNLALQLRWFWNPSWTISPLNAQFLFLLLKFHKEASAQVCAHPWFRFSASFPHVSVNASISSHTKLPTSSTSQMVEYASPGLQVFPFLWARKKQVLQVWQGQQGKNYPSYFQLSNGLHAFRFRADWQIIQADDFATHKKQAGVRTVFPILPKSRQRMSGKPTPAKTCTLAETGISLPCCGERRSYQKQAGI